MARASLLVVMPCAQARAWIASGSVIGLDEALGGWFPIVLWFLSGAGRQRAFARSQCSCEPLAALCRHWFGVIKKALPKEG